MKLERAIEILLTVCNREKEVDEEELWDAQKLGIEALKRRKYQSEQTSKWADIRLPGETEE